MKTITKKLRKTLLSIMLCCGLVTVGTATVLATRGDPTEAVQAKADETVYYLTDGTSSTLTLSEATMTSNVNGGADGLAKFAFADYDGQSGLKFSTAKSAVYIASLTFAQSVPTSEVGSLTFRVYLDGVITTHSNKLMIYAPQATDRNDLTSSYQATYASLLGSDVANGWVTITLTRAEALKLADENGNISGVQLAVQATGYGDASVAVADPFLFLDYVSYEEATSVYEVTFDYNETLTGKAPVTQSVDVTNLEAEMPEVSIFGYAVEGYYKDSAYTQALDLSNTGITGATTVYAKMVEYELPEYYLTDGTANSLQLSEATMTSNVNGGSVGLARFAFADYDGQSGLKFSTAKAAVYIASLTFGKSVTVDSVSSLTFRMYIYGESKSESQLMIYAPQATERNGTTMNYKKLYTELLPTDTWNGWVSVTLSRSEALELADASGNISGIQLAVMATKYENTSNASVPFVFLDYVSYEESNSIYNVTFDYNQAVTGIAPITQSVDVADLQNSLPAAASFGYEVEGWYKDSAYTQALDFNDTGISGDTTIYAKMSAYELPDNCLSDGTASSLKLSTHTITEGPTNDGIAANRVSYATFSDGGKEYEGVKFLTAKSAYYVFGMAFLNEVNVSEVDYVRLRMYIGGIGENECALDIFPADATDRYQENKLSYKYSDLLPTGQYDGWVNLDLTKAQLQTLAVDGKINGVQIAVLATKYTDTTIKQDTPFIFFDEVTYTVPVEISAGEYAAFDGTYYSDDGKVLILNSAQSLASVDGVNGTYKIYTSGTVEVTVGGTLYSGNFDNAAGEYSLNGVTYFKYANQQLEDTMLSDMTPWFSKVSEPNITTLVNSFWGINQPPKYVVGDEYKGGFALMLKNGSISAVPTALITFGKSVPIERIHSLSIRMYVNVGECAGSFLSLYSADATDRNGDAKLKYMFDELELTTKGYGWITITVSGDDLAILADKDGNIGGITVMMTMFYSSTLDKNAHILLDYIEYVPNHKVTLDVEGKTQEIYVPSNTKMEMPAIPEKSGYVFVGWKKGDTMFDIATPITEDVTLTACFETTMGDVSNYVGLYVSGNTYISLNSDKTITVRKGEEVVYGTYAVTQSGKLCIYSDIISVEDYSAANHSFSYAGETYAITESIKVTFMNDGVAVDTYIKSGMTAVKPQDPSKQYFVFDGWKTENADTLYTFEDMLTANITLYAVYSYDEITDYAEWLNEYYNEKAELSVRFEGENALVITNGTSVINGEYHVTVDGILIFVIDGNITEITYNDLYLTYSGKQCTKLWANTVTFVDGTSQTTLEANYANGFKVAPPSELTKEGYVFVGWRERSTGVIFDFDKVVTKSITLVAEWKLIESVVVGSSPNEKDGGCSSSLDMSAATIGITLLGAAIVVTVAKKKKE